MELAHKRSLIARLLQPLREEDFVLRQNVIKSVDTVSHDAFAGQQAGAAGGADRTVHVAIVKYHPLLGNPVKIWGLDRLRAVAGQRIEALLVSHDQQDVGCVSR